VVAFGIVRASEKGIEGLTCLHLQRGRNASAVVGKHEYEEGAAVGETITDLCAVDREQRLEARMQACSDDEGAWRVEDAIFAPVTRPRSERMDPDWI
jgi:hypothetical protein